ncbi:17515_t:CDS:2, partial [Gigaspora margarita]
EVTSLDKEVVKEISKKSKYVHAFSKSPVQTSKTTTEEVHEISDNSEGFRQYDDPQQETSSTGASSQK